MIIHGEQYDEWIYAVEREIYARFNVSHSQIDRIIEHYGADLWDCYTLDISPEAAVDSITVDGKITFNA